MKTTTSRSGRSLSDDSDSLQAPSQIVDRGRPDINDSEFTNPLTDIAEVVDQLAGLSPIEYEQQREKAAQRLGCRVNVLDAEVKTRRKNRSAESSGDTVPFREIEPWPNAVDGAVVLDEIQQEIARYAMLPKGACDTIALWAAHAHAHRAFLHSPRLNITAPERGCGKTLVLDLLETITPRPLRAEGVTAAVTIRMLHKYSPTLLIDEYDTFLHGKEELRGALNAGHKRGGRHWRCEGDTNEIKGFETFGPVALAGIRDLPGTLADRSIIVKMQRISSAEKRESFDSRRTHSLDILNRKLARWVEDNFEAIESMEPMLPEIATNRTADNWRPIFAIAEIACGPWPERARDAFAHLGQPDEDSESTNVVLLGDIRDVFADLNQGRISSKELIASLLEMEERPWPEFMNGRPLSTQQLANLLKPFCIKPKQLWLRGTNERGYDLEWFEEAFRRYLPHQDARLLENPLSEGPVEFRAAKGVNALAADSPDNVLVGGLSSALTNGGESNEYKSNEREVASKPHTFEEAIVTAGDRLYIEIDWAAIYEYVEDWSREDVARMVSDPMTADKLVRDAHPLPRNSPN